LAGLLPPSQGPPSLFGATRSPAVSERCVCLSSSQTRDVPGSAAHPRRSAPSRPFFSSFLSTPPARLTAQHLLQVANHTAQRSMRFQQSLRQCSECPLFHSWSGQWTASDPIIEARLYQARRSQPKEDRLGPMLVSLGQGGVRIYSEAPTLPGRLLGISIVFHSHASPVYEKRCCSPKRGARKTRLPIFALMVYASRHAKAACVDEVHAARHIRQHACSPSLWLARAARVWCQVFDKPLCLCQSSPLPSKRKSLASSSPIASAC
jgi:hypothetical protein